MTKLTIKEIKVIGEGLQVREAIINKFGSIEAFITFGNLSIYSTSVESYCNRKKMVSNRFQEDLERTFACSYSEIATSEIQQVLNYVDRVYQNMKQYNTPADIKLIDKLIGLCLKYDLPIHHARMYRAKAMTYFYCNEYEKAHEMMKVAINQFENMDQYSELFACYSELALMECMECNYKQGKHYIQKCSKLLPQCKLTNKTQYLYYYRSGMILKHLEEYETALKCYTIAMDYSDNDVDTADVYLNMGIVYKKLGEYKTAIELYLKALDTFNAQDAINKSVIYNNIGELHKAMGDYDKAVEYTSKAIELNGNQSAIHDIMYKFTLCEIMVAQGRTEYIDELRKYIKTVNHHAICNKFFINSLTNLYNYAKGNSKALNKLDTFMFDVIKYLKRFKVSKAFMKEISYVYVELLTEISKY